MSHVLELTNDATLADPTPDGSASNRRVENPNGQRHVLKRKAEVRSSVAHEMLLCPLSLPCQIKDSTNEALHQGFVIESTGGAAVVPDSTRVNNIIRKPSPRLEDKSRSPTQNQ